MKRWAVPFLVLLLLPGCAERPVLVAGSSCMGRMMAALAEGYAERYGKAVEVQLGGTELGLLALGEGGCDLASCSRDPEGYGGIDAFAVAVDAIAVVVHPSNPVASVSLSELRGIYAGEITDWEELGASPAPIVVVGREAGSGTRLAFEQAIGLKTSARHAQEQNETGLLRTAVSLCPGAIGYLSFDYAGEGTEVRSVPVEGMLPSEGTVRSRRYPLTRRLFLCARRGETRSETLDFLSFCRGGEGQALIRSLGIIGIDGEGSG